MEPPVVRAKWKTPTIKSYLKEVRKHGLKGKTFRDLGPDEVDARAEYVQQELAAMGWKKKGGFSAIRPMCSAPFKGTNLG